MRGTSGLRVISSALILLFATAATAASGIKVTNGLMLSKCTACHANKGGVLSRISFLRKAPEGWEETLWRHKRIHGVAISREEKETIVSYLSETQGLSPAEVAPYAYTLLQIDTHEKVEGQNVIDTCVRCHSYAKSALQRRTPEEWGKLANTHAGVLPMWLYQLQDVIDWDDTLASSVKELAKRFPLETKEWKAWVAARRPLRTGKWVVAGYEPGKGPYEGELDVKAAGGNAYAYTGQLRFPAGAAPVEGKATLYGGYAWRGGGTLSGNPTTEIFHLAVDGTLQGVRFPSSHHELRGVETWAFAGGPPSLLAAIPAALPAGARDQTVTLVGTSLSPPAVAAATGIVVPAAMQTGGAGPGVSLGEGVTVKKVLSATPTRVELVVDVRSDASTGKRRVKIGKAEKDGLLGVYRSVDYIKVTPSPAMSRTGGKGQAVKQLVQFDAVAMSSGKDAVQGTPDDFEIGRVPARWKVVELMNSNEDRDVEYVGAIDPNGLFTPGADGPNENRRMSDNNVGDVWVDASWTAPGGKELTARAYMICTIPLMIHRPVQ